MYQFFVEPEQIEQEEICIYGNDRNHIVNVLRMKAGERIQIGDRQGNTWLCCIEEIDKEFVRTRILESLEASQELKSRIYLFQGLPKGDKMELIIQKAVELGAYEIIPVKTKRTVVKLDEKKEQAKKKRWQMIAESAAKQSKRQIIPEVSSVISLTEAFLRAKNMNVRLIPYEEADTMQRTRELIGSVQAGQDVAVFIGPEGGFDREEIEEAIGFGIQPITLGKRILRTETAGLAVLSVLMYQLEE